MKLVFLFFVVAVVLFAPLIYAEAPMHEPSLDHNCGRGFQWSRDVVGCVQADCPAGAGRMDSDACNCGEAWGQPFRTCYDPNEPGLVTSCVSANSTCPGEAAPVPPTTNNPASQCTFDHDCPHGQKCTNSQCVSVSSCRVNSDCPVNYDCNPKTNQCETTTQCNSNRDCPAGSSCDLSDYSCVRASTTRTGNHSSLSDLITNIMRFLWSLFTSFNLPLTNNSSQNANSQTISFQNGSCHYDSDCSPICVGSVYWKQGCDPQTNSCLKTFDTDCNANPTQIGGYSFAKLCTPRGCVDDDAGIHSQKEALVTQANKYTAALQQTTLLRQTASHNCLSALSDVTSNLIVSTALIYSIPSSVADLYSATTQNMIDQINNAASTRMSPEEYISLNCNALRALDGDYALISLKRERVMQNATAFAGR